MGKSEVNRSQNTNYENKILDDLIRSREGKGWEDFEKGRESPLGINEGPEIDYRDSVICFCFCFSF